MTEADCLTIAGYRAAWTSAPVEVSSSDGVPLPCDPIDLYTLADAESSIDAAALLRERVIEDPPYWALVWTGAQAIAATIANRSTLDGKPMLDLGCGLGLSGLAAARRGAHVTFGDYLDEPLEFVRRTIERSSYRNCTVRRIDFTGDDDDDTLFDVILAADIVYDPAHYAPLSRYLDCHLAAGSTILLTESLRADATVFLAMMDGLGFADEKSALWVMEAGRRERTWLHELRRR